MREELKSFYPKSWHWHERVDKMSDRQAFATLIRIRFARSKLVKERK